MPKPEETQSWNPVHLSILDGLPSAVAYDALLLAARMAPDCSHCKGTCECGEYAEATSGIIYRYIQNWDRQHYLALHVRTRHSLAAEHRPVLGYVHEFMKDVGLNPKKRHPEPNGFEKDHVDGEQWRRFHQPLKTKGK